jgi:hypothetical protein
MSMSPEPLQKASAHISAQTVAPTSPTPPIIVTSETFAKATVDAEWQSLLSSMYYWFLRCQKPDHKLPALLVALVNDAYRFANYYRDFFDSVPDDVYKEHQVTRWVALHQARERLASEWDTIRTALEQRVSERYGGYLEALDLLAAESIAPVATEVIARQATTYLHKVYDITRFAFSQAPLIGAPLSALHLPETWLALPHEAGHFLFWNVADTTVGFSELHTDFEGAIIKQLATSLAKPGRRQRGFFRRTGHIYMTWLRWLNELFADIYGTLVAGPAIGWSMQALVLTQHGAHDLDHDDGEHPVPYLRPFIHIATLRRMAELSDAMFAAELSAAADELRENWAICWPDDIASSLQSPDGWGKMSDLIEEDLPPIVEALLDVSLGINDGAGVSLAERYRNGKFYTHARHQVIIAAVQALKDKQPVQAGTLESMLNRSAIAQLAIAAGVSTTTIQSVCGFTGQVYQPATVAGAIDRRFADYMAGLTGTDRDEAMRRAWRRVVDSNLSEAHAGEWHHHPHIH